MQKANSLKQPHAVYNGDEITPKSSIFQNNQIDNWDDISEFHKNLQQD